jgi:hypothetical protein
MACGRNGAAVVFLMACIKVHRSRFLPKYMILPLQEAQMIIEAALFLSFVAIAGAIVVKSLRMATGRPLRTLHQAERLEEVGAVPANPSSRDMYAKRLSVLIARR